MVQNSSSKWGHSPQRARSTWSVWNKTTPQTPQHANRLRIAWSKPLPQGANRTWSVWTKPSSPQTATNYSRSSNSRQPQTFINDAIKAFEIVVIDEAGENLGQMKRFDALALAQERGVDLVQMSYNPVDKVSTTKLMDYGKFLYDKKKSTKEKTKNAKKSWLKQIKFGYAVGTNDLLLKIKKTKEMLAEGYMVKISIKLKGRENIYSDKAIEKLIFIKDQLADVAKSQSPQPQQDKNTFAYTFVASHK